MTLEKPSHMSDEAWRSHLHWMKIMQEGQLTRDRLLMPRPPRQPRQLQTETPDSKT